MLNSRIATRMVATLAAVVCLLIALPLHAQQSQAAPSVVVLPFQVNAEPDLDYLHEALPTQITERLRAAGLNVSNPDAALRAIVDRRIEYLDLATARDLALMTNSAFSLYGSFSQIGQTISLDARLVDAYGNKAPVPIYVVKEGIISLLPAIDELVERVKESLLKQERIAEIDVEGNDILEKDVVLTRLRLQIGESYDPKLLNEDLKRIYGLGYFDDVQVKVSDVPGGKRVVFMVKEKPRIQVITIKGAEKFDQDEILKAISSKAGSVLNPKVLSDDLGVIREMYRKEGYYKADIGYDVQQADARTANLTIAINEGPELYIRNIEIAGAKELSESEVKGELALGERWMFSWFTGSGVLKEELLDRDAAAIEAYYGNRGFLDVKVAQPEVDFRDDGIYITFRVVEGKRYKVGKVDFSGDLLFEPDKLAKATKLDDLATEDGYFNRSTLRDDIQALNELYGNWGFAYADTDAKVNKHESDLTVDVNYTIDQKQKVYIRRVIVEGNDRTRENVIRRQVRLGDGDLYNGFALKRSNERLNKTDYFEKVEIEPVPVPESDRSEMDLRVRVKEKATGMLSAGAGYSSFYGPYVAGSISERNLFGRGYELALTATVGRSSRYNLGFTNPSVYDSSLAAGGDIYRLNDDYVDFDKDTTGGRLRFGYPLGEYTRLLWQYRLDHYTISDVDDELADEWEKRNYDWEGNKFSSVANIAVNRDTTDKRLNPSRGSTMELSLEYGGGPLGGDDNFIKPVFDTSWYTPLWKSVVFHWHGQVGHIFENPLSDDDELPPFERFFLGGINSVRGYETRHISPMNEDVRIGGDKELFTNFELIFPVYNEIGLMGVAFFDAGKSWDVGEMYSLDMYKSVGVGLRWYSPLGPLRLEYGYPLDDLEGGGDGGKVEFTVGQFF